MNPELIRQFLLASFELKIKLATLNCGIIATELDNYLKYAETTAENFGRDLKKYSSSEDDDEPITGETIRRIIRNAKEKNPAFLISSNRAKLFLKLFNIIADNKIKDQNKFSLKNKLVLDFYKYPGTEVLLKYIVDNKLYDSFTAESLLEYIITRHDEISSMLCNKLQPRVVSKILVTTGTILKKNEWHMRTTDNLLEQQSIVNDPDFDETFLPKDVGEIFTGIDKELILFMSKHLRFLRLISKDKKPEDFAKILGIKETSLLQYETTHKKLLTNSMICNLVNYFTKEQDKRFSLLFDYFFTEISWPAFSTNKELRHKFSELISDYTFLNYTKYQRDNSKKKKESMEEEKDNIRQKSIDLLEIEIKYFVFKTIDKSGYLKTTLLPELQELIDR